MKNRGSSASLADCYGQARERYTNADSHLILENRRIMDRNFSLSSSSQRTGCLSSRVIY